MIRINDILDRVSDYHPEADLRIIERAYIYSAHVHEGQVRLSGETYLSHPLEVAYLLTEMKMDVVSVVAGLLHDTIEDTDAALATPGEYGAGTASNATVVRTSNSLGRTEWFPFRRGARSATACRTAPACHRRFGKDVRAGRKQASRPQVLALQAFLSSAACRRQGLSVGHFCDLPLPSRDRRITRVRRHCTCLESWQAMLTLGRKTQLRVA